jgi:hypothetical protein
MTRVVARYKIKPDQTGENARLVRTLFAELEATAPADLRFATLELEDGTFLHLSSFEDGATRVSELHAFHGFHEQLLERCAEPPIALDATIVGNYRMLAPDGP